MISLLTFPLKATRLTCACKCFQPLRYKKYHYALPPQILPQNTEIDINDPHLYKTVEPISKWNHSGSNWSENVSKMMGMMQYDGERETAREVMRQTFAEIKFKQMGRRKKLNVDERANVEVNPINIIDAAVKNCTPVLILHAVRRGGFLYKVPAPPRNEIEARHIAIRWILESARNKPADQRIWVSLAHELVAAAENEGGAIAKKKELLRKCEENRAYANYRIY